MSRDNRSYKNFNSFPTFKLEEIINSEPYYTTNTGHDYGPYIEEIKEVYYRRTTKNLEIEIDRMINRVNKIN